MIRSKHTYGDGDFTVNLASEMTGKQASHFKDNGECFEKHHSCFDFCSKVIDSSLHYCIVIMMELPMVALSGKRLLVGGDIQWV